VDAPKVSFEKRYKHKDHKMAKRLSEVNLSNNFWLRLSIMLIFGFLHGPKQLMQS